jgi:hypothetical protein
VLELGTASSPGPGFRPLPPPPPANIRPAGPPQFPINFEAVIKTRERKTLQGMYLSFRGRSFSCSRRGLQGVYRLCC